MQRASPRLAAMTTMWSLVVHLTTPRIGGFPANAARLHIALAAVSFVGASRAVRLYGTPQAGLSAAK